MASTYEKHSNCGPFHRGKGRSLIAQIIKASCLLHNSSLCLTEGVQIIQEESCLFRTALLVFSACGVFAHILATSRPLGGGIVKLMTALRSEQSFSEPSKPLRSLPPSPQPPLTFSTSANISSASFCLYHYCNV